jgi:hypothetical protein
MAYSISLFAGAGAQFFDDNGTPLAGGLLYTYLAGTTTPATTYTTPAGNIANTNPIVLDAGGRTPYEVWVGTGVLYKFVLKDSDNVTIGTYDNIPSINDPTIFNNLITVTGTNALLGTSTPANIAYVNGMTLSFAVVNTNTGPVTIDVDGLGAKEIVFNAVTPLVPGQLIVGSLVTIEYDGVRFQLSANASQIAPAVIAGSTATRPATPIAGLVRLNTDTAKFEGYNGSVWSGIGGGATGGGSDAVFIENNRTVTTSYTIPTTNSAMSTGPITINAGVVVTVPTGCKWVIL